MFYLLGESERYAAVANLLGNTARDVAQSPESYVAAYGRMLNKRQPNIPLQTAFGVELVDDQGFEQGIVDAFYHQSPLDDLPRYRDKSFFEIGPARREGISADVRHVDRELQIFVELDRSFWTCFGFFVRYIMCPYSRYSRGGTDSAAVGTLFISRPRTYSSRDLYEILVHECTHTMMFVDEMVSPHYCDEASMALEENFSIAALSGTRRPLDKALHSLVVSTELFLHRELVLGHDAPTMIHPSTSKLVANINTTIESLNALNQSEHLLAPRAWDLVRRCAAAVKVW